MDSYALLMAATLNAGTVLAIASLGLLINEKVGIVNLGAEGMMLCSALAGFAAVVHTGNPLVGFAAGMAALLSGALAARFAGLIASVQRDLLAPDHLAPGLVLGAHARGEGLRIAETRQAVRRELAHQRRILHAFR